MPNQLNYGDVIYLCVSSPADRWLSGWRGEPNEHVVTRDGEGGTKETTYQWTVMQSRTTTGTGGVSFGDVIYLKCGAAAVWLSGWRGEPKEHVVTRNGEGGAKETTYQWTVMQSRTSTGSGGVGYGYEIYLKCGAAAVWLTGARGDAHEHVVTRDGEGGTFESRYKWVVSANR